MHFMFSKTLNLEPPNSILLLESEKNALLGNFFYASLLSVLTLLIYNHLNIFRVKADITQKPWNLSLRRKVETN